MTENIDDLINTMNNSPMVDDRINAIKSLSGIKNNDQAVDALIAELESDWSDFRTYVADALGEIGNERAIVPLSNWLQSGDNDVRNHCAKAIVKFGIKAIANIQAVLHSESTSSRRSIIEAMGETKNSIYKPYLMEALNDSSDSVLSSAIRALGELGDSSVCDTLIPLLKSNKPVYVKMAVKGALKKLGVEQSKYISSDEYKAELAFLLNLKAIKVGMSEKELNKLVGPGVFQMGTRRVYKNQYGEFQLIIANGKLVEIPQGFGPAYIIREMEAYLST